VFSLSFRLHRLCFRAFSNSKLTLIYELYTQVVEHDDDNDDDYYYRLHDVLYEGTGKSLAL
jgi:hypothetical protein